MLEDLFRELPGVAGIFDEYAAVSGLILNFNKTIVIPLWRQVERSYEEIGRLLAEVGGGWERVLVRSVAKYLGFLIGPGRDEEIWAKPVAKWQLRARSWGNAGVGLQFGALVYNVFCASVLCFLAQMEPVPEAVHSQEESTMLLLAKGPKAWANSSDLWRMGEQCGMGRSFHCVKARGEAAMLRAYHYENWEEPVWKEVERLRGWQSGSEQHDRQICWSGWYQRSFPVGLQRNRDDMAKKGITVEGIRRKLCAGVDLDKDRAKLRASLQGEAARANVVGYLGVWEYRIDHKLGRWGLKGSRHRQRDLLGGNLRRLGRLVAPRVAAAVWGMVWNRWCTARRFQSEAPCVLGCGQGADSIEHYMGCRAGREVGGRMLRVMGGYERRKHCMLGVTKFADDTEQTCWAVLVYGLYMTTNARRRKTGGGGGGGGGGPLEVAVQEIMQHCRQAADGHLRTTQCLSKLWLNR